MTWEQLNRTQMLTNKKLAVGILLGCIAMYYGGLGTFRSQETDFLESFLWAQTENTTSVMALLFPLLSALPEAVSYREERDSGYYILLTTKMEKRRYVRNKLFRVWLAGFLVIGIPNLLYLICSIFMKGTSLSLGMDCAVSFAIPLYRRAPLLYAGVLVGNAALCGGTFALLSLGISAWVKNKYLALVLPFMWYLFSGMVLIEINPWWNAIAVFSLNLYSVSEPLYVLIQHAILLAVGIGLFVFGVNYEEKKQGV